MDKNKVVVSVGDKAYTLVGAEPAEYMQRVASYVDRRMSEIGYSTCQTKDRLTVLTAINLADELLKSKDEVSAIRKEMALMRQKMHQLEQENARAKGKE